jgi:WD40 repeat protein
MALGDLYLSSASSNGDILIHDITNGQIINKYHPSNDCIRDLQFNTLKTNLLASCNDNGIVHIWG